jgi:hypothetical protein
MTFMFRGYQRVNTVQERSETGTAGYLLAYYTTLH